MCGVIGRLSVLLLDGFKEEEHANPAASDKGQFCLFFYSFKKYCIPIYILDRFPEEAGALRLLCAPAADRPSGILIGGQMNVLFQPNSYQAVKVSF